MKTVITAIYRRAKWQYKDKTKYSDNVFCYLVESFLILICVYVEKVTKFLIYLQNKQIEPVYWYFFFDVTDIRASNLFVVGQWQKNENKTGTATSTKQFYVFKQWTVIISRTSSMHNEFLLYLAHITLHAQQWWLNTNLTSLKLFWSIALPPKHFHMFLLKFPKYFLLPSSIVLYIFAAICYKYLSCYLNDR